MENTPSVKNQNMPAPVDLKGLPAVFGTMELGFGHEKVEGINEIEIPRAKLVQFTSDEAQAADAGDRVQPGLIINSITRQEIGKEFIPVFKFTTFTQWNPRKKDDPNYDPAFEPGEIIFTTNDPLDKRVREGINFGPNGEPPKVTRYMNFMTYFPGQKLPLILSFAKTSMKAGERLNTLALSAGGNQYDNKYKIVTRLKEGPEGKYFVLEVVPAGASSEEERRIGALWFRMCYNQTLKVHAEAEETQIQ